MYRLAVVRDIIGHPAKGRISRLLSGQTDPLQVMFDLSFDQCVWLALYAIVSLCALGNVSGSGFGAWGQRNVHPIAPKVGQPFGV